MPNYVRAEDTIGTKLIKGFFKLLATLGDWVLQLMQKMMMGTGEIINSGQYEILYSPGIIFSNQVAALKVDFVGQTEEYTEVTYKYTNIQTEEQLAQLVDNVVTKEENFIGAYAVNNQAMVWIQSKILGTILYYKGIIDIDQLHDNDWRGVDAYYPDWEDFQDNLEDGDLTWREIEAGDDDAGILFNKGSSLGEGSITKEDIIISSSAANWDNPLWDSAIERI